MNRNFRAAESQMQAPVQQQRQGRSLRAVMKDKEEDLTLFLEMRKREKERNSLLLLHTSEDFDPLLGSKPGGSPIFKIVSSTPQYAMGGKSSTHGDVYSYGIFLLEMFKDNLSLHHFAKLALAERVMDIVDPQLLLEAAEVIQGNENQINARNRMHDCLISMVKIGVLCSAESRRKRMQMRDVVAEMQTIRTCILWSRFAETNKLGRKC